MIPRHACLTREQFFQEYYFPNRPVVLTAMMDWPAIRRWHPKYLQRMLGTATVEVMDRRDSNPDYESESHKHRQKMLFSDYIGRIQQSDGNNLYMVAQNEFLRDAGQLIKADIPDPFPTWLDLHHGRFLWFGPAGTITPLHYDIMNILFAQIHGRKRLILFAPHDTINLYPSMGVHSAVNAEHPDLDRHPLFSRAQKEIVELNPGEALFIPINWWHAVRSLDLSISVSFINFTEFT